jgi:hypothetical protein
MGLYFQARRNKHEEHRSKVTYRSVVRIQLTTCSSTNWVQDLNARLSVLFGKRPSKNLGYTLHVTGCSLELDRKEFVAHFETPKAGTSYKISTRISKLHRITFQTRPTLRL